MSETKYVLLLSNGEYASIHRFTHVMKVYSVENFVDATFYNEKEANNILNDQVSPEMSPFRYMISNGLTFDKKVKVTLTIDA